MEDIKTTKINKVPEELPEVKRLPSGEIDLESITIGEDSKGNKIVDDYILDYYYRELPKGIVNKTGTWRTNGTGGKLKILGGDPEADREIQIKGANVLNATLSQQRSYKDRVKAFNQSKVPKFIKEAVKDRTGYEIPDDMDLADAQVMMMNYKTIVLQDTGSYTALRDTSGEKPVNEISATIEEITPEDREMMRNINRRLNSNT